MPELNHGDLRLSTPAFEAESPIPDEFAADGENVSPPLQWSSVPDGTLELALLVHDPDAPLIDGFTHWVVTGIEPTSAGLPRAAEGLRHGLNSLGQTGWTGMAPPPGHGVHHYFFHLYALDKSLKGLETPTREVLLREIDGHIIEQARLVGTYRIDE